MGGSLSVTRWVAGAACAAGTILGLSAPLMAQAPTVPSGASAAKAKELVTVLQEKKLSAFAVRDTSQPGRYVAVYHVPGVQLLLVSALYERPTDLEYRLYQKDFSGAYADLRSSVLSKNKHFVEDAFCDGLVPHPPKGQMSDTETVESTKHIFDGDFADPKKRNQQKITFEAYAKQFTTADEGYTRMLTLLLEELKKVG